MSSYSPGKLVTRFAPSPTGYLHLGNARTALLSFLAARKGGGRFILRVEDTDEARSSEALMVALFADLKWLGIDWDEGPDIGGPHQPYRQQERVAIYDEWLSRLEAAGLTYPCFCTKVEQELSRKRQLAAGQPPRYAGTCRNLTSEERAERVSRGLPSALRFRVPDKQLVSFVDVVHGEQRFNTDDIGDFIVRRTDGTYVFFFTNAVDDALMDVTLVLRGDDHMTNTPRQILLLQALNLRIPQYAHVALLLGMDGAPLSKRHGHTSLRDMRERGYLAGALCNHLVRLGHTCVSDGYLDEAGVIAEFDLNRLGRAAAKFDEAQLRHWQKEAVAHLSTDEFLKWIEAELPEGLDAQQRAQFVTVVRANIELPSDARAWAKVIFGKLDEFEPSALAAIREAGEDFFTEALKVIGHPGSEFKQAVKTLGQAAGKKGPALFMPLRAALTGFTHGPELAPMLALLPFAEVQARLEHARRLAL